MSVSDGQRVNAQVTNAAYISRTTDTDTVGKIDLNNPDTAVVTDVQATINDQQSQITSNDSDIATLQATKENIADKGQPNGYAELDGTGRIPVNQLPTSALTFLGNYDASTNTPTLADGVGTNGDQYRTNVPGTQDLGSGNITFNEGDTVTYNGSIWEKQDFAGGTDALTTKGDLLSRNTTTEVRVPVGTDGQVLIADSAEASGLRWGAQNGGVGGINYISNPDFETDFADWNEYNDGAVSEPVDGTGGTADISATRSLANPLRGTAHMLISKGGINAQGSGVSTDFTIDNADTESTLNISFDYSLTSLISTTNFVSGDVRVFIYDIDNATPPVALSNDNNGDILSTTDPSGRFTATFASTDSLNYRLIFHVATTNALAWDLTVDNVVASPVEFIPVNLNREATFDLTGSGDFTAGSITVRRSGNLVNILSSGNFTHASLSSVSSGTILPDWAVPAEISNVVFARNSSTIFRAQINTDGTFTVDFRNYSGSNITLSVWSALNISYQVPGSGNVVSNTELTQKTVTVAGSDNAGTALTANVTNIDFTEDADPQSSWNGTEFVAPISGNYEADGSVAHTSGTPGIVAYIDTGSGAAANKLCGFQGSSSVATTFSWKGFLNKGDVLSFRASTAVTLTSSSVNHWIGICSKPDFSTYGVANPNADYQEVIDSTNIAYPVGNNTYTDLVSLTLPPGEWEMTGVQSITHAGSGSNTWFGVGISTTSGNSFPDIVEGYNSTYAFLPSNSGFPASATIPKYTVNITTATTYYLKGNVGITTNVNVFGRSLTARRIK